jgi:uncharacterized protein YcfJ
MRNGMMIAIGAGALIVATGVGAAMMGAFDADGLKLASSETAEVRLAKKTENCRAIATAESGFDPATTPVPVRADAGNKQVLKGTAVGAAVGAVAGEVIGSKPGYGAAAGAAAGAAGGQAVKVDKQQSADERYAQEQAWYQQQKATYETALTVCLND